MSAPDLSASAAYLGRTPIAGWLRMRVEADGEAALYRLAFDEAHIGNPAIRAIHGGVVAAFLETAMLAELARLAPGPAPGRTSFSIDYLTSSRPEDMTARIRTERIGRRLAFLSGEAWQRAPDAVVGAARGCFRLAGRPD